MSITNDKTVLLQFTYKVTVDGDGKLGFSDGYRLYAALLEMLPDNYGDILHTDSDRPISQYVHYDKATESLLWVISIFSEEMCSVFKSIFTQNMEMSLKPEKISLELVSAVSYADVQQFIEASKQTPVNNTNTIFQFETPVSFKQAGKYVIFPQEKLILHSLITKWDAVFPNYPLNDPDAVKMLEEGIRITDYNLKTYRFKLKGTAIPSCKGTLTIRTKLPLPLYEVWNILAHFACFGGLGIKTTLGMGGISLIQND